MEGPRGTGRPPLSAPSLAELPLDKPDALALAEAHWKLLRLDSAAPDDWSWAPFAQPRYRFDSLTGQCRVRYAATTEAGAMRERYRDTGMFVPAAHHSDHWCTLEGELSLLDLRSNEVLDALGLDARISSSYESLVRFACHSLTDRVRAWWGDDIHGIAFASRTTPETSINVAFFESARLTGTSAELADCADLLEDLVLTEGLQVDFAF